MGRGGHVAWYPDVRGERLPVIATESVTRIVRMFVERGSRSCAPYLDRQRTFWMVEGIPFHMVNVSPRGNKVNGKCEIYGRSWHWLGEHPLAAITEPHMRRYAFRRHCDLEGKWSLTVNEQILMRPEIAYATLEAPIGDATLAVEDLMFAFMKA